MSLDPNPSLIFDHYFERKPPFDFEDSKEFPDGFVVEALVQWCRKHGDQMLVVTQDKAMLRAASANEHLIALKDFHELLTRAAADLGAEGEAAAEAVLNAAAFEASFEAALSAQMPEAVYVYVGDLPDGDAYEGELLSVDEVNDWSVVGLNDRRVTLLLDARLAVRVEVQFEDRSDAMYDSEDDQWLGTEVASTQVEEEVDVKVLVEAERTSGTVREAKIMTPEIKIHGRSDWDY